MSTFAELQSLNATARAAASRHYTASSAAERMFREVTAAVARTNPAEWELHQFAASDTRAPGSEYLVITPPWADSGRAILLVVKPGDAAFDEIVGSTHKMWSRTSIVLPLDGPAVARHKPLRRLAALARMVLAGTLPGFDAAALEGLRAEVAKAKADEKAAIAAQKDVGHPADREIAVACNDELFEEMRRHDWWHIYADRCVAGANERERKIEAGLRRLDPDEAALLVVASGAPAERALWLIAERTRLAA